MCNEIDNINTDYEEGNYIAAPYATWDKICRLKHEGGLGIRKTEDTNAAFLAKQRWKILTQPVSFRLN